MPDPSSNPPPNPTQGEAGKANKAQAPRGPGRFNPLRRWTTRRFRWNVRMLLGIPIILALLVLVLMRSPLVGWLVASQVRQLSGCQIEGLGATGAYLDIDGRLVVKHFQLRLPGIPGDAAIAMAADRAVIDLDWSGILTADIKPIAIRLEKPVFRVSQSIDDGELNLLALASRATGATPAEAPKIDVIDGKLLIGEHDKATGRATTLREMRVSGSFMPIDNTHPVYSVRFAELGAPREKALLLDGKLNLATGQTHLKLYNLALDAWKAESIPTAYRDLWRRLNVQGKIASASLDSDKQTGLRAEVVLEDVSMNALIPAESAPTPPPDPAFVGPPAPTQMHDLALRDVSGTVRFSTRGLRADLSGQIEGQSGHTSLTLVTQGLDANSALSCELNVPNIGVGKEMEALPYIPERAKTYLRLFSGPTGEIDVRVIVSRGAPVNGEAADFQVSGGRVRARHATAAFQRFPYPFHDMTGEFEFDDNKLRIVRVEGTGPTGAHLTADGVIAPLDETAMVDVNVHVEHVPVDQHLLDAMRADRRRVIEAVFSRPEYLKLLADKLVRPPGSPADPGAPPEFGLAGDCTVDVHCHTPEGKDAPWTTNVDVYFPTAGMLIDPFPLPILARDVRLHITDDDAKLLSGSFAPLSGGSMTLSAAVDFVVNGHKETKPDVRVTATDVPIDALLLHALPPDDPHPDGQPPRELQLGELVRRLNASGALSARIQVGAEAAPPDAHDQDPVITYDVDIDLHHARARPRTAVGDPSGFAIDELSGTAHLTRTRLTIDNLQGHVYRLPDPTQPSPPGPIRCAALTFSLDKHLSSERTPPSERGRTLGALEVSEADLSEPLERLIAVFSPDTSRRLAELRAQRQPSGFLHATIHLDRPAGDTADTDVGVVIDKARNLELSVLGERVALDWPEGVIEVHAPPNAPERLRFDHVRARIALNGQPAGETHLDGSVTLSAATGGVAAPADLTADFTGWRFESPLIPPMLTRVASSATADTYRALNATGEFDAHLKLTTDPAARPSDPSAPPLIEADLSPRSMAFDWKGARVRGDQAAGRVTLKSHAGDGPQPVAGHFDKLVLHTPNWDAWVDGAWYVPAMAPAPGAERPVRLAIAFGVDGRALDSSLRALMPSSANEAIDALEARFRGPFSLREGDVKMTLGDTPSPTTFTGQLDFSDVSLSVGVPIDHCTGHMSIHVENDPANPRGTTFDIRTHADNLRLVGIDATSADAAVVSGDRPGVIRVPEIAAQCYGGRLSGSATITLPDRAAHAPASKAAYDAEFTLAGVHLAPVLADAASSGATDPGPTGPPDPTDPDPTRGLIDARLTISGLAGDLSSRRGGGAIRISNGDIIRLPLMLPLIQVSNFQIPSHDRLGYLQSDFTIQGDTAFFEHVTLLSNSISIVGSGTLKWPDLTLNMKFNSRANKRVPFLSDVFEALRNEIVSTTVRGKLNDPIVREEPFTGTRRMIDRIINPEDYVHVPPAVPPAPGGDSRTAAPSQP